MKGLDIKNIDAGLQKLKVDRSVPPVTHFFKGQDLGLQAARDSFPEELIVRRELAMNFAHYAPHYDSYKCLPNWARQTLNEDQKDAREYHYTRRQLENAQTHDEYWNAAMREMRYTGFMHNYMRIYWGKKTLEWSKTPDPLFETPWPSTIRIFWTDATPTLILVWPGFLAFMTGPGFNDRYSAKSAIWLLPDWNGNATSRVMSKKLIP